MCPLFLLCSVKISSWMGNEELKSCDGRMTEVRQCQRSCWYPPLSEEENSDKSCELLHQKCWLLYFLSFLWIWETSAFAGKVKEWKNSKLHNSQNITYPHMYVIEIMWEKHRDLWEKHRRKTQRKETSQMSKAHLFCHWLNHVTV